MTVIDTKERRAIYQEQFVGLNDYAETLSGLLMSSGSSRHPEPEDFTPLHEEIPSNVPLEPFLHGPPG